MTKNKNFKKNDFAPNKLHTHTFSRSFADFATPPGQPVRARHTESKAFDSDESWSTERERKKRYKRSYLSASKNDARTLMKLFHIWPGKHEQGGIFKLRFIWYQR